MFRKLLLAVLLLAVSISGFTQSGLTLPDLLSAGKNNFPLFGRDSLFRESANLQVKNLNSRYFPSLSLEGKASWQSDVTTIDLPIPGINFPEFPKDQYKINVDIKQMVFDGGLTQSAKEAELLKAELLSIQTGLSYVPLYHQLNSLFHGILLLNENEKSLNGHLQRLQAQENLLKSLAENGMSKASQLAELHIEKIKIQQSLEEIAYNRTDALNALKILTGISCTSDNLTLVSVTIPNADFQFNNRPEIKAIDQQLKINQLQKKIQGQQRLPKLYAFAQLGYGKPGLNMFATEFNEYAIAGFNLSWTIYDWGEMNRNRKKFDLESAQKEQDRAAFMQNTQLKLSNYQHQIEKLEKLAESQRQVVELRKSILIDKEKQMKAGTILEKAYLDELNLMLIDEIKLNELAIKIIQNSYDLQIENGLY